MALQVYSFSSCFQHAHYFFSTNQSKFAIRSQNPSESSKPTTDLDSPASVSASPKKPISPGVGFGSSSPNLDKSSANTAPSGKRKSKGKKERDSIIRRSPIEKPAFVSENDDGKAKEQSKNESAFLLAWLGFGAVILVEGIALAASGFLPEDWDKIFVKYLYPSFTPTVFSFVAGTVAYGVYKYLQNEKITELVMGFVLNKFIHQKRSMVQRQAKINLKSIVTPISMRGGMPT